MTDDLTVLCTGDLHLGRHPSRIPTKFDGQTFSPKSVWQSTVRQAIDRGVDVVAITGDVVDRENRYFEAYGAFEEGVVQLDDAGIPTVVVSGNHDFDVLPRMTEDLNVDSLKLLGEDGNWERSTITRNGEPLVHFDGWSFPSEHVLNSPMDDYDLPERSDAPLIGLLHADLNAQGSEYAPIRTSELRETSADGWLLGHIHKPTVHVEANPLIAYLGSPQPLDPGERGSHGPWLLTFDSATGLEAEQLPLATVRYDRLDVDVSQAADSKAILPVASDRIGDHVRTEVDTGPLELLLVRIRLTGRTEAHGEIVEERRSIEQQLALKEGSLPVHVESLEVDTRPEADLEELARGDSPAAYVADLLLDIEDGSPSGEYVNLIDSSLDAMQQAHGASAYNDLRGDGTVKRPDEEDALETVRQQARTLLDTLLEQKEGRA